MFYIPFRPPFWIPGLLAAVSPFSAASSSDQHIVQSRTNVSYTLAILGPMRVMLIVVAVVLAGASPAVAFQGFERHLNCPFSKVWLEHGPERAAEILGVDKAHAMPPPSPSRRLDEATKAADTYKCTVCQHVYDPSSEGGTKFEDLPASWKCPVCGAPKSSYKLVAGQWTHDHDDDDASAAASFASCSYMNPFANANTCFELRGGAWTDATAKARCDAAMANVKGTLVKAGKCTDAKQMGWCMSAKNTEASLATGASCAEAKTACESWTAGGVFQCTATGAAAAAAAAAPGAAAQGDGGGFGTGTNDVCVQCVRALASSTPTQMYSPYQLILSICSSFLPTSSSYRPVCHRSRTYRRSPPAGCIAWVRHGLQGDPGGGQQVHVAAPLDGIRTVSEHEVRIRRHPGTSTEVYEPVLSVYQ